MARLTAPTGAILIADPAGSKPKFRLASDSSSHRASTRWLGTFGLTVRVIAAVKLVLNLYLGRHYGCFVDELYYVA